MGIFMKVVATGAKLVCSAGSAPSRLLATSAGPIHVEGKAVATIFDGKPFTNIPPFGTCDQGRAVHPGAARGMGPVLSPPSSSTSRSDPRQWGR